VIWRPSQLRELQGLLARLQRVEALLAAVEAGSQRAHEGGADPASRVWLPPRPLAHVGTPDLPGDAEMRLDPDGIVVEAVRRARRYWTPLPARKLRGGPLRPPIPSDAVALLEDAVALARRRQVPVICGYEIGPRRRRAVAVPEGPDVRLVFTDLGPAGAARLPHHGTRSDETSHPET
jgi:hypothetical protein